MYACQQNRINRLNPPKTSYIHQFHNIKKEVQGITLNSFSKLYFKLSYIEMRLMARFNASSARL